MQPHEVRQFRDGTIDYNNYHARPISLAPTVRRLCRWLTSLKTARGMILKGDAPISRPIVRRAAAQGGRVARIN